MVDPERVSIVHDTVSPAPDVSIELRRIIAQLKPLIGEVVQISGGSMLNGKPRPTWVAAITGSGFVAGRPFVETEASAQGNGALRTYWGDEVLDGFRGATFTKIKRR